MTTTPSGNTGDSGRAIIGGRVFIINSEAQYEESSGKLSGSWHAWCFFAYDKELNIYPAEEVPRRVETVESIVGADGDSEQAARFAVEEKLTAAIRDRELDGTGFYSPPGGFIFPHGVSNRGFR